MRLPLFLERGKEQYQAFKDKRRGQLYQYDYRDMLGELFSCVKPTLEECRKAKDEWLKRRKMEK